MDPRRERALKVAAACAALYVIWGTTYFAIGEAVRAMPPLTMAAIRFLLPGLALYAWARAAGLPRPGRDAWWRAAVLGILMLGVGNGAVSYAETNMPSSIAALLVATVPMWTVVLDWRLGAARPRPIVWAGLAAGLAGVALLASRDTGGWARGFDPALVLLIIVGSACWAFGSLWSRRGAAPASFWQDLSLQMLAGGAALALAGVLAGEAPRFDPLAVPWHAWAAVLYLSVFGSVVALACFLWLLRNTSPAVATTYGFVNPAVAVLVGAAFGEPLTWFIAAAAALIVVGVALIVAGKARQPAVVPVSEASEA